MIFDEALDDQRCNESHQVEYEEVEEEFLRFVKLTVHNLLRGLKIIEFSISLFLVHHLSEDKIIENVIKVIHLARCQLIKVLAVFISAFLEHKLIDRANLFTERNLLEVDDFMLDLDDVFLTFDIFFAEIRNPVDYFFNLILRVFELVYW